MHTPKIYSVFHMHLAFIFLLSTIVATVLWAKLIVFVSNKSDDAYKKRYFLLPRIEYCHLQDHTDIVLDQLFDENYCEIN